MAYRIPNSSLIHYMYIPFFTQDLKFVRKSGTAVVK